MSDQPRKNGDLTSARQRARVRVDLRWPAVLLLSVLLAACGEAVRLPASLLLGPMAAAIVVGAAGRPIAIPRAPFYVAQAVIGCLMARDLPPAIFTRLAQDWLLSGAAIVSVVVASAGLGIALSRLRILPGTTAIWGSMPGAASVMVLLAPSFGADARLVAFMQYLRVVMVAGTASAVGALVHAGAPAPRFTLFAPVHPAALAPTLALILAAATIGPRARLPAGPLLIALFAGTALSDAGVLHIELPPLLLTLSYALLGWTFGARFTREMLARALHALPRLFLATAVLIGLCALLAVALAHAAHVDLLTAYLATSPGGADSIAIIASGSHVDAPFVMVMQAGRFLLIMAIGPTLARLLAGRIGGRATT